MKAEVHLIESLDSYRYWSYVAIYVVGDDLYITNEALELSGHFTDGPNYIFKVTNLGDF